MIWYGLSKGDLKLPDPKKYTLVCTYLTLMELAFSQNNFKKLVEVQAAIGQIFKGSVEPELILLYPYDHANSLLDQNFKREFDVEEDLIFGFLRCILNQPLNDLVDNDFKKQLANISDKRMQNNAVWASFLNNLEELSNDIPSRIKKRLKEEWTKTNFRKWFVLQLNYLSEIHYSPDKIDWNNFEFYEQMYSRYKRKLFITKMKTDMNDENDLKNMIYVQPGDLYWTLENRWLNIAKEIKMDNYLYQG